MYLKTILGRDDEELTKRIFREQQRNPTPGDFAELVKADFTKNNIEYKEDFITAAKVNDYKSFIRKNVKKAAFEEFKNMQAKHSKVSEIRYEKFEKQSYLQSPIFSNEDVEVLSNMRSHTTRGIRDNFKQMYLNNQNCPLECWPPGDTPARDTQEHLLVCSKLKLKHQTVANEDINYEDIYKDVSKQKAVVTVMKELLDQRNYLLQLDPTSGDEAEHWTLAPPGAVQAHQDSCNINCSVCNGTIK